MNLTNIFLGLVSLTNLTIFMNRLINDGPYQSAILIYDYESIGDTNFIQVLTDSPTRNYTIVTVCGDKNAPKMLKSISYRNILGAVHVVMVNRGTRKKELPNILFARDIVYLIASGSYNHRQQMLWNFYDIFSTHRGNISVILYETPLAVKQNHVDDDFKSIAAYGVNARGFPANRSIFQIDRRRDIHFQLNKTANLVRKIFPPFSKRVFMFFAYDDAIAFKNIGSNKNVLSDRVEVYMANFITRNMKNVVTLQVFPDNAKNVGRGFKLIKYEPSTGPIYADLFVSSMEDYVAIKTKFWRS